MQPPALLIELIDKAALIAGSDYKLAKKIGTTPQTMSNWRHGAKPCPAADVALIAEVAGLDPQEWLSRATLWKYSGTAKGDKLHKALGKTSAAITGVLVSSGAAAASVFETIPFTYLPDWLSWCSTMYRKVKLFPPISITFRTGISINPLLSLS